MSGRRQPRARPDLRPYESSVLAFDRELTTVEAESQAVESALQHRDGGGLVKAACDLVTAYFCAEAAAVRVLSHGEKTPEMVRFARLVIEAINGVVVELLCRAWRETWSWKQSNGLRVRRTLQRLGTRLHVGSVPERERRWRVATFEDRHAARAADEP